MNSIERRQEILKRLQTNGMVSIQSLADELQVSSMTIRRDLNRFADQGLVRMESGGALLNSSTLYEHNMTIKSGIMFDEKVRIAQKCLDFIKEGDSIFLDAGTTTERMIEALRLLRQDYGFGGYIHAKAIPGADPLLTQQLGLLADRLSVNIELPSAKSLALLAPDKGRAGILAPMAQIRDGITQSRQELAKYHHAPRFAPAGQSTQMIVGATPESDRHILMLTQGLYDKYHLKRVFYSAYIPVSSSSLLPAPQGFQPPLLREHRLYQADWLLRFYHFRAEELLDEGRPDFDLRLDPKCGWALRHLDQFPVEVQRADYEALLRVPGIGVTSAKRILTARRAGPLSFSGLKKLGVVLKRAQYFITCSGRMLEGLRVREEGILSHLAALERPALAQIQPEQLSLFGEEGAS